MLQLCSGKPIKANQPECLVRESKRIEACQRSYDTEFPHRYGVHMCTNTSFLSEGGHIEEAVTLLNHIKTAVVSFFHCVCTMGCLSNPYGTLQGWTSIRKKEIEHWLPIQQTFDTVNTRITTMRSSPLSRQQVQRSINMLRRLRPTFSEFYYVIQSNLTQVILSTQERAALKLAFERDADTSPINKMRNQVLLPMVDCALADLLRVLEFLDGLAGGNEIEHWMMLDSEELKEVGKWKNTSNDATCMTTVGQALDTLRTDPSKFKAFAEMTRHMSEMMRVDS
jgi:hypothetical protein